MSCESVALHHRFGIKLPRYNQIVNALTWMSHSQALKRMSRDYVIDLYLRPPVRCRDVVVLHVVSTSHYAHVPSNSAGSASSASGVEFMWVMLQVWHFRLMDYHLMERIVRDSNRCRAQDGRPLESAGWLLQALAEQAAVMPALTRL